MSQCSEILSMLRVNKRVTMRELFDAGVGYTARNRIGELRREGFVIRQENGACPSDNAYILESEPVSVEVVDGQREWKVA